MNIQIDQPSTLFVYWFMRLSYGIVDLYQIQTYVAVKSKPVIAIEYTSYM